MQRLCTVCIGLCLPLLALAQAQARGGRGAPGRGMETIPGATPELVQALYQQGGEAVGAVPAMAAPALLTQIAGDEMRLFPQQGLADFERAFDLARALPPPQGPDDTTGAAREVVKENAERQAVSQLARLGDAEQALSLTRLADIPKGTLYDQLIMAAGRPQGRGRGTPAAKPNLTDETPTQRVIDLVQECERTGSYPYIGVGFFLRQRADSDLDRISLVRDGYQWTGNLTDPTSMEAGARLLQAGHRAEPELDPQLESTLLTLLHRLFQAGVDPATFGAAPIAKGLLLTQLQQIDPAQAAATEAQWGLTPPAPGVAGISVPLEFSGAGGGGFVRLVIGGGMAGGRGFAFSPTPPPSATAMAGASSEAGGDSAFLALVAQAESWQRKDPHQALALAGQAAGLLDDSVLADKTVAAAGLATLDAQLGASDEANRLLARCLDQADQQARTLDAEYLDGGSGDPAQLPQALEAAQSSVLEVYSLAARIDFVGAAERAEAGQFVLLKPLVLARVALVGELGQRPNEPNSGR